MKVSERQTTNKATLQILAARKWFASIKGQRLLSYERPILQTALSSYAGRYVLYWGPLTTIPTDTNYKNDVFHLGPDSSGADIICQEIAWPIITESVATVVLQHSLDFSLSPHDLLREAARVIRPGGHLLVVGFNPFSSWGVYRRFCFNTLRKSNSITYYRLLDWLKLLGFSIDNQWFGGYYPPFKRLSCLGLFNKLETLGSQCNWFGSGFYVISACKLMTQITPSVHKKRFIWERPMPFPLANNRSDVINDK